MPKKILANDFFVAGIIILALIFFHKITVTYPMERMITWLMSPFQIATYSFVNNLTESIKITTSQEDYKIENENLRKKIEILSNQIINLKNFIEENKLLEAESNYLTAKKFNFLTARIISRNHLGNDNILIINKGLKDGVRINMAVVAERGTLIGKIIQTQQDQSFVLLLIDSQCRLSASLAGNSEITGVVSGSHNSGLILSYVLKDMPLDQGTFVISSGEDNAIPGGLLIGELGAITDDKTNLFKQAEIISPIDFKHLKIVSVILN